LIKKTRSAPGRTQLQEEQVATESAHSTTNNNDNETDTDNDEIMERDAAIAKVMPLSF
jgi:pyrrolidone-carboxylate peptidase